VLGLSAWYFSARAVIVVTFCTDRRHILLWAAEEIPARYRLHTAPQHLFTAVCGQLPMAANLRVP
jgi:hypothetical protein